MKSINHCETLNQLFIDISARYSDNTAFIYRVGAQEFTVTYEKLFEDVLLLSRVFHARGISRGDRVMLLSDNRYGWIVTDFALMSLGAISVPRGSDTPTQELEYILTHSGATHFIAETAILLDLHAEILANMTFKGIYVIEASEDAVLPFGAESYREMLAERTVTPNDVLLFKERLLESGSEDVVTMIYTSGTTGFPKGVVLTHTNIVYNVRTIPPLIDLTHNDSWLSILPTWHIYERAAEYCALASGCTIVYSTIKTFSTDLEQYRPTIVATVPRLWESMYAKVNAAIEKQGRSKAKIYNLLVGISVAFRKNLRQLTGGLPQFEKKGLFAGVVEYLKAAVKVALLSPLYPITQKRFGALRAKFGGRLRLAVSGGGSLPQYIDEWIDAIGIRIVNAYGMSECAPLIAGRDLRCSVFGTLGGAPDGTEILIMGEGEKPLPAGHEGEIYVRGPQVMPGYYNNPEENEKAFTKDRFFRTGDLGKMTLTGQLVITGRSKEIIVLASGENIDPTRIEAAITRFPFVQDAVLVGQDKKGLGALIVPDIEKLREYVHQKFNRIVNSTEELLQDSELVDKIKKEMNRLLHPKKGFKPYEKLFHIHFLNREFRPGVELTNTLKKRRHVIERTYHDVIHRLFHKNEQQ